MRIGVWALVCLAKGTSGKYKNLKIASESRALVLAISALDRDKDYRLVFARRMANVNKAGSQFLMPEDLQFGCAKI